MRQFVIIEAEVLNPVFDLKGQRERKAKAALQRVPLQVAIAANGAEPMSCLESASAQSTNPPKCQILSWGLRAPNILAIDLGTQTGWAIVSGFGSIRSGSRSFKLARDEAPGLAFWRFARWLTELEDQVQGFDAVYYEAVFAHKGTIAAHKYGAFEGQLLSWCAGRDIPVQGVAVGTIKKHATGIGYAGKQAVIDAMCALGFDPSDDNEADALALLQWALAEGDLI